MAGMSPSERRKQMKEQLNDRLQESYNNKDDSGKYKPVINKSALGKVGMWKCGEGEHFINIIPYVVGDNHPTLKPGSMAYSLDWYEHRKVGVNEDTYVCLSRTFNRKCPVCEKQAEERKQDDYEEKYVKSLNPTRRVLYNIECLDSEKEANLGIQLFEVSHYLFEKELAETAKKPRGGGFELFSDPDDGKIVFFRRTGTGANNTEYKAFKFEERSEPISDDLLDAALCLDSLIHIPTYEEVYAAFHGYPYEGEEAAPARREVVQEEPAPSGPARRTLPSARQADPEPEKIVEEEPAPAEFVHPCESAKEYGTHGACENCPDVDACEGEYNAILEEEKAAEEERRKEEAAKAAQPAAVGVRRVARGGTSAPAEPAAEPAAAAPAEEGVRRIRRRPGA